VKEVYEEEVIERRREFQWRVFLAWSVIFVGILLLLPVNAVLDGKGGLAMWFVFYLASGASILAVMGVLIKTQRPLSERAGVVYLQDGGLDEEDLEGLENEDKEMLRSLRELREWYIESLRQVMSDMRLGAALEKWYHLAIAKEIEIRNLKRVIRQLKRKVREKTPEMRRPVAVKTPYYSFS
jgi:hypothetical protein